jgi:hypothetical protein
MSDDTLGCAAYEAYCESTGFASPGSMSHREAWRKNPNMQKGWLAVAKKVQSLVRRKEDNA